MRNFCAFGINAISIVYFNFGVQFAKKDYEKIYTCNIIILANSHILLCKNQSRRL